MGGDADHDGNRQAHQQDVSHRSTFLAAAGTDPPADDPTPSIPVSNPSAEYGGNAAAGQLSRRPQTTQPRFAGSLWLYRNVDVREVELVTMTLAGWLFRWRLG